MRTKLDANAQLIFFVVAEKAMLQMDDVLVTERLHYLEAVVESKIR